MKNIFIKKSNPIKKLSSILKANSGRDNTGTVSVRHQGGGHKRKYRMIDFSRNDVGTKWKVVGFEYDPNRSANLARVRNEKGDQKYMLHTHSVKIGQDMGTYIEGDAEIGKTMPLSAIPLGSEIHNLSNTPTSKGKMIRSSGNYGVILSKDEKYADIKLPSKEVKKFLLGCLATMGRVAEAPKVKKSKAGRTRHLGIRPTVRGVAQNPRSHPHGGGEGRSGEGMHPKTPWGKPARGKRTAFKLRSSRQLIVKSRKD